MKVLIVYDSVSSSKLTAKVADMIAATLRAEGIEVDSVYVKDAGRIAIGGYNCLIVGSPTMAWKPTPETLQFLEGISQKEVSGKLATSFDTRIKSRLSGSATKKMEEGLEKLGFKTAVPSLAAYVEGRRDQMRLKEGELEKARNWANGLAKTALGK